MELKTTAAILLSLCTLAVCEQPSDPKLLDPKTLILSPENRNAAERRGCGRPVSCSVTAGQHTRHAAATPHLYEAIVPRLGTSDEEAVPLVSDTNRYEWITQDGEDDDDDDTDYPTIDFEVDSGPDLDLSMAPDLVTDFLENLSPLGSDDGAVAVDESIDTDVAIDGIAEPVDAGVTYDVDLGLDQLITALKELVDVLEQSHLGTDVSALTNAVNPLTPTYILPGHLHPTAEPGPPGGRPHSYPFQPQYGIPHLPYVTPPGYSPFGKPLGYSQAATLAIPPPVAPNAYPPMQNGQQQQLFRAPYSPYGKPLGDPQADGASMLAVPPPNAYPPLQSGPIQQVHGSAYSPFGKPLGYPQPDGAAMLAIPPPVTPNAYPPLQNRPHLIYGAPSSTIGGTLSGYPEINGAGMVPIPSSPLSSSGVQQAYQQQQLLYGTPPSPFGTLLG